MDGVPFDVRDTAKTQITRRARSDALGDLRRVRLPGRPRHDRVGAEAQAAPQRIQSVAVVEALLHLLRHRLVFVLLRAGLDLLFGQADEHCKRLAHADHRQRGLRRQLKRRSPTGGSAFPARQPVTRVHDHPAELPVLDVEQEVLHRPDAASVGATWQPNKPFRANCLILAQTG
jgi:hypothetical protein